MLKKKISVLALTFAIAGVFAQSFYDVNVDTLMKIERYSDDYLDKLTKDLASPMLKSAAALIGLDQTEVYESLYMAQYGMNGNSSEALIFGIKMTEVGKNAIVLMQSMLTEVSSLWAEYFELSEHSEDAAQTELVRRVRVIVEAGVGVFATVHAKRQY